MSARIEIDLDAFRHNVRTLAAIAAPARTMLAVKADGYGHGMLPIARAALESGADSLAVLDVTAALALREAGIDAQLFAWLHGADTDFRAAIDAEVDLGVSSLLELERIARRGLESARRRSSQDRHRSASQRREPRRVAGARAGRARGRRSGARSRGSGHTSPTRRREADEAALAEFQAAIAVAAGLGVPTEGPDRPILHLAASSAGIRMPEARFDLVRFGIAAYGSSPFDDTTARDLGMRAPMTRHRHGARVPRRGRIARPRVRRRHPPYALRVREVLVGGTPSCRRRRWDRH